MIKNKLPLNVFIKEKKLSLKDNLKKTFFISTPHKNEGKKKLVILLDDDKQTCKINKLNTNPIPDAKLQKVSSLKTFGSNTNTNNISVNENNEWERNKKFNHPLKRR